MPESSESTDVIRWNAEEHRHFEHTNDWFWALWVIVGATALTALLFGNFLFALLIIVAGGTVSVMARTPARRMDIELSKDGVKVGDTLHTYKEILAFFIVQEGDEPILLIDTKKFLTPNLILPIEEIDPVTVRAYLLKHVKEVEMREPVSHKVLEFFGF